MTDVLLAVDVINMPESSQGYQSRDYADSLAEFGSPLLLPACGGNLLVREIPNSAARDVMGCYPVFSCVRWSELRNDLLDLGEDLVTVALVADPLGEYTAAELRACFPLVRPFKEHVVVDLRKPVGGDYSKHHRREVARSLRAVEIERCANPIELLDEWVSLYQLLVTKRGLSGIKAFSRTAFARQLQVPGLVMFRATCDGVTVGMHLWYEQGEFGYSHLSVTNDRGRKVSAAYALYAVSIEWFAKRLRWLNLGGSAGTPSQPQDGLSEFKRGWSTDVRQAYFCGKVLNQNIYDRLIRQTGRSADDYFPAYRAGEFG